MYKKQKHLLADLQSYDRSDAESNWINVVQYIEGP